jgi:tungstate transport system substrate-binding protein
MKFSKNLAIALVFFFGLSQLAYADTDTRIISLVPKEIYGTKTENIKIRIGNGGAGPTGILRALAEDFIEDSGVDYSIAWYQDISPNTLKQLKNGTIDIALVYEKSQGDKAQKEGWATNYTPVFNDHFLVVGPKTNPAKLIQNDSAIVAFSKIAAYGKKKMQNVFLSRDDNSGTNIKELEIWRMAKLAPAETEPNWYFKYQVFPKDALLYADKNSLYLLTDFGTWLSNKDLAINSQIYSQGQEQLLNQCFALLGNQPRSEAIAFLDYLKSERAQKLIAEFGKEKYGMPLFTPAKQIDF